jgi:hypothetical protein
VLNIANTLVGDDSAQAPEGGGILAVLMFTVVKQQACTLFIEKGFAVDYEQIKDSVKTYTGGVICLASTGVLPASAPHASRLSGASAAAFGVRNSVRIDVLGRRISNAPAASRFMVMQNKKILSIKR